MIYQTKTRCSSLFRTPFTSRPHRMNTCSSTILILLFLLACQQPESRIEVLTIHSEIFHNQRKVRVYLPPDYDVQKLYKVLLLNDGQNVFGGPDIKHRQDWRVDEIVDSLIHQNIIEPLIIVAIDNIGLTNRGNEYLPWEDIYLDPPLPNPEGRKYPEFLMSEVIPLIKSKYPIGEGKEKIGIGGFSYGGLIAIYCAMYHPDFFGFVLAETPSLYVNDKKLLNLAKDSIAKWPDKIYMGVGTNEMALEDCDEDNEDNRMAVDDIIHLGAIITDKQPSTEIKTHVVKCATHSFEEASKRLPEALRFLFE